MARLRIASQRQVTPPLYGEDAKRLEEQISRKLTAAQLEWLRRYYHEMFSRVRKRGLG